ncbi:AAA family ATPase [Palleronia sp. KMU-117]|uniref:AAA family ATPase n=1 Tax=Palleronia sp. KMU-117 TaxID=3434108 RepID=UPI003D75CE60
MKLRAIRLENVRRFVDKVEIGGIGDGLNVLSAPNEQGKSTVFDAMHALFFKDRKSWDREIRSLAPHAGGDPSVGVDVEINGAAFRIEKRWTKARSGEIRVWRNGQLFKQADDAEAWLASVVKPPRDGGPAGLLWVRQGLTDLPDDGDAGRAARRDLMSSVAGEVEAMTGGRRMDIALSRCGEELRKYLTATGRPKADGPLKRLQDEVAALETRAAELEGTAEDLRRDLARRRQVRKELEEITAPEAEAERQARLAEARRRLEEAQGHAERLRRAGEAETRARRDVAQSQERLEALLKLQAELEDAGEELEIACADVSRCSGLLAEVRAEKEHAEGVHVRAKATAEAAAETLRRAIRAEAVAAAVTRRAELAEAIAAAERHRATIEDAQAAARQGLTAADLEALETLERDLRTARRALDADAAWLSVSYANGRDGAVSLEGRPLTGEERVAILSPVTLEVAGVGHLVVHPAAQADAAEVARKEEGLRSALDAAKVASLDAARASARARAEAEQRLREAKIALDALAPQGLDRLRDALAALPQPESGDVEAPDRATAQSAEAEARRALRDAETALEIARSALGEAQRRAALSEQARETAEARRSRALAALPATDDLEAEVGARRRALAEAAKHHETTVGERDDLARDAPDLAGAQAAFDRAASIVTRLEEDRQRLRVELGQLDATIALRAGEAVEEELADTAARLEEARRRLAALEFEVAVLQRLQQALEEARATARDRYVEPVKRELVPLLRLLWDDSELQFDAEEVLPTALIRNGQEEDISVLSGGTREQIALLVRLAFARMLAKAGMSAPVILDDGIVYTDDDRLERMFDALTRQAQDLQILVFSCRQKAFRDLGGRSLSITSVASAP